MPTDYVSDHPSLVGAKTPVETKVITAPEPAPKVQPSKAEVK